MVAPRSIHERVQTHPHPNPNPNTSPHPSQVNMAPRSIYERVENCNYACDVAKRQQMKVRE